MVILFDLALLITVAFLGWLYVHFWHGQTPAIRLQSQHRQEDSATDDDTTSRIPLFVTTRGFLSGRSYYIYFLFGVAVQYVVGLSLPLIVCVPLGFFNSFSRSDIFWMLLYAGAFLAYTIAPYQHSQYAPDYAPGMIATIVLFQVVILAAVFASRCVRRGCISTRFLEWFILDLFVLNYIGSVVVTLCRWSIWGGPPFP